MYVCVSDPNTVCGILLSPRSPIGKENKIIIIIIKTFNIPFPDHGCGPTTGLALQSAARHWNTGKPFVQANPVIDHRSTRLLSIHC